MIRPADRGRQRGNHTTLRDAGNDLGSYDGESRGPAMTGYGLTEPTLKGDNNYGNQQKNRYAGRRRSGRRRSRRRWWG